MRITVIDVGSTNAKVGTAERRKMLKIPSGPTMTAARMVTALRKAVAGWKYGDRTQFLHSSERQIFAYAVMHRDVSRGRSSAQGIALDHLD